MSLQISPAISSHSHPCAKVNPVRTIDYFIASSSTTISTTTEEEEEGEGTDFLTGIRPSAFGCRVNRTYLQYNEQKEAAVALDFM